MFVQSEGSGVRGAEGVRGGLAEHKSFLFETVHLKSTQLVEIVIYISGLSKASQT